MKIVTRINGREHTSIAKPKMRHLRVGGKLLSIQDRIDKDGAGMYEYIEEIYEYIKDTFPKIEDKEIDNISTERFMELVGEISQWANGGYKDEQKKN